MVYSLVQKGRWVYIRPFPDKVLLRVLRSELSYEVDGARFMPNPDWAVVKLYQEGRGRFPVGLVDRVCEFLPENITLKLHTFVVIDDVLELGGLYPFQKEAVRNVLNGSGGILSMPTGSGKTRTALKIIQNINKKTLVIVPSLELKTQWQKQTPPNIDIKTYQSLKSKKYIQQFELIIFDECHMVAAKTLQLIGMNLNESAITVGLSATPFMRSNDNLKVESVIGPIVYEIGLRELVAAGYLVDAKVVYHNVSLYDNDFNDYPMMYDEYIVNNYERNNMIVRLAKESDGFVLILVNKIVHGKLLEKMLVGESVRFINGSSKNRDDNDYRIIIATSIYDQGVDIPRLNVLVLGGGGKSAIQTTQRIGRVLRKYDGKVCAVVHDFVDNSKWLFNHYKKRRKIFEKDFEVVDDVI